MNIKSIIENELETYIYMERYVNNGSPSGFDRINTSSKHTSPREGLSSFKLPVIRFDNTIKVINVGFASKLLDKQCIFCHPDNLETDVFKNNKDHWEIVNYVDVAPTASARTVRAIDFPYFVKLDYIGKLGRISRNLDYQHLLSAYEVTNEFNKSLEEGKFNKKFGFLKEDKGILAYLPFGEGFYEFGCLIRNVIPTSKKQEKLFIIPGFSLFGIDINNPSDELIAHQLLKESGLSVNEFVLNKLTVPIVESYFDALVFNGLANEAHAQNTLVAINENFDIKLIIFRDLESVDKDLPLREFLGIKENFKSLDYKCLRKSDYNYSIKHSFMFDFKLGEYLLKPLIDCFEGINGFDKNLVINRLKNVSNERIAQLPKDYFDEFWYSYENKEFKPGEKRPYIANLDPKFR